MGTGGVGGNITTYTYDAANNPTQVALPAGAAATSVYSTGGSCGSTDAAHPYQAKCATDDAGNRTSFSYDTAGNTLEAQDTTPDSGGQATAGRSLTTTYQGTGGASCGGRTGQVCSEADGEGNTTSYTYDTDANLATATPPAPLGTTSYGYDSIGRLTSFTDAKSQTTTYAYDVLDHRTATTVAGGGAGANRYATFDPDGNQTGNDAETTTYDAQNRAEAVFPPTETAGAGWQLARDAAGSITSTFPGATVETTTIDNAGRATRIRVANSTGTVLSDLAYSYTVAGGSGPTADRTKVQSRTDHLGVGGPAGSITRYDYDTLKRLLSATETTSTGGASASWAYTDDDNGNRLTQVRTGNTGTTAGTTTYAYNAADQLTTINGSASGISYDANGNQAALPGLPAAGIPAQTAALNTGDQVASVTVAGTTTDFVYNGNSNDHRTRSGGRDLITSLLGLEHTGSDANNNARKYIKTPDGHYDPSTGRFTQPDPTGQEANIYLYAAADPINRSDRGGDISTIEAVGLGIAAIGPALSGVGLLAATIVIALSATTGLVVASTGFLVSVSGFALTLGCGIEESC